MRNKKLKERQSRAIQFEMRMLFFLSLRNNLYNKLLSNKIQKLIGVKYR